MLRRMHHHAGTALALALDVSAWAPAQRRRAQRVPNSARPLLVRQGWRAVTLGPRDRLDLVWQDLGRTSAHAARSPALRADEIRRRARQGAPMRATVGRRPPRPAAGRRRRRDHLVTMLSWRGFSDQLGRVPRPADPRGRRGRRSPAPCSAPRRSRAALACCSSAGRSRSLVWLMLGGSPLHPIAERRRRRRRASPTPGPARETYAAADPGRRARHRPAADPVRRARPARGRLPRLLAAAGPLAGLPLLASTACRSA